MTAFVLYIALQFGLFVSPTETNINASEKAVHSSESGTGQGEWDDMG